MSMPFSLRRSMPRLDAAAEAHAAVPDTDVLDTDVLDAEALARLRELDPTGANGLLGRVLNAFQSSVTRLLPQMHAAQQRADAAGVRYVVHTLKSSSASIGAIKLSTLCAEIESMIRLGNFEDMQARVDAVEAEAGIVLRALARVPGVEQ